MNTSMMTKLMMKTKYSSLFSEIYAIGEKVGTVNPGDRGRLAAELIATFISGILRGEW